MRFVNPRNPDVALDIDVEWPGDGWHHTVMIGECTEGAAIWTIKCTDESDTVHFSSPDEEFTWDVRNSIIHTTR